MLVRIEGEIYEELQCKMEDSKNCRAYSLYLTKGELETLEDALEIARDVFNDQAEDFEDEGSAKARDAISKIQVKVSALLDHVINQTKKQG